LSTGSIQRRWRDVVLELQCRFRLPGWVDVCGARCGDLFSWHLQCAWRYNVQ
jgi:hypothetical protein